MRDELFKAVWRLCELFPQLRPAIKYSEVLSQEDVDLFAAFANGHVQQVLHDFPTDEKAQDERVSLFLQGSTGLSRVREADVQLVSSILTAASGNDTSISPDMRDLVDFLRAHKRIWWSLHGAYEKIVKNNVVGTCPVVVASPPLIDRILPFGSKMHKFQEFHKLFHESVHFVLEENGICFHDADLDEGLVTYFHQQVAGKSVCALHYVGDDGARYLKNAALFEKFLSGYAREDVVPTLKHLKVEDLKVL